MHEKLQGVVDRLNMITATLLAVQGALLAQHRVEPDCCKDELALVKRAKSYVRVAGEEVTMLIMSMVVDDDQEPF